VLNKLSYSVTFPTTGRTLAGEFEFKPGFGLINGANEQGKSLIIEVVRTSLLCSGSGSTCYEQLRDIELWQRKQQFERRHPRPDYPASFRGGLPALRLPNVLPST
jgi:predicted ATPase